MVLRFGLVVTAAACLLVGAANAPARAQDADAPAKVPFSAFRIKPILDRLHDQATPETYKLKPAHVGVASDPPAIATKPAQIADTVKPPAKPRVPEAPIPAPAAEQAAVPQQILIPAPPPPSPLAAGSAPAASPSVSPSVSRAAPEPDAEPHNEIAALFSNGIPVPPRKPDGSDAAAMVGMDGAYTPPARVDGPQQRTSGTLGPVIDTTARVAIERIPAQVVAPGSLPHAEEADDDIAAIPEPEPETRGGSVRIRDRSRFESNDRSAGLRDNNEGKGGFRISNLGSGLGIPGLRLGKLNDMDGVSPVLIPGNKRVAAAPDYQSRLGNGGVPHEVIVFFRENSTEMEAGQMDVVNNDVLGILRNNPGLELEIRGYSEEMPEGPNATGKMALARAMMVRDYLAKSVDDDRLTVKGKGDDTDVEPRDRVEMYFSR